MSYALFLYDTTLRDGSQRRGISFTLNDKLKITRLLDEFGVHFIEGGWPGSNPKDAEYFVQVRKERLTRAKSVAFGSTRRKGIKAVEDGNIQALLAAETPAVAVVGKSWKLHVEKVLGVSSAENLDMIAESLSLLKREGREVIYDAEHFFDGYRDNPEHALATLRAARNGGADWLVLCDTNGGSLPAWVAKVVREVRLALGDEIPLGIHTHNDSDLAVANALAGVEAGVKQIQGTINGYGERCGNCNLISVIPAVVLKMNGTFSHNIDLTQLSAVSRRVSDIANITPDTQAPYVGASAFAHKGGIHVAAVEKLSESYEHIDPSRVGNQREIVVSELSGKGNIRLAARGEDHHIFAEKKAGAVLQRVKDLEAKGFQFENAAASFELLLRREYNSYKPPFAVKDLMVVSDERDGIYSSVQAILKIYVEGDFFHTAAEGTGPVHAIDQCLRKALEEKYPQVKDMRLVDYKVRILDPECATAARVRVNVEAECDGRRWITVGCHQNIIKASTFALLDSFEYLITSTLASSSKLCHVT